MCNPNLFGGGGAYCTSCGDGTTDLGEDCDDGNNLDGDDCPADCIIDQQPEPFCGDGSVNQPSEECDDGGNQNGDGCNSECQNEPVNEIPEFTTFGAALAIAGIGTYLYSRRNRK